MKKPRESEDMEYVGKSARRNRALSAGRMGEKVDPYWNTRGPFPKSPAWATEPPSTFKKQRERFETENPEFGTGANWSDGDFTAWDWSERI